MTAKKTKRATYPPRLNGRQVWEYIQQISGPHDAHDEADEEDGGDYEPWPTTEKFVLTQVPIAAIKDVGDYENERIDDYAMRSTPFPPIVMWSDSSILDGQHRVNAARQRGDTHIAAYKKVR